MAMFLLLLQYYMLSSLVCNAIAFVEEPSGGRADGYCGRILRAQTLGTRRDGHHEFRLRVEGDPEAYQPGSTYRGKTVRVFSHYVFVTIKFKKVEGSELSVHYLCNYRATQCTCSHNLIIHGDVLIFQMIFFSCFINKFLSRMFFIMTCFFSPHKTRIAYCSTASPLGVV